MIDSGHFRTGPSNQKVSCASSVEAASKRKSTITPAARKLKKKRREERKRKRVCKVCSLVFDKGSDLDRHHRQTGHSIRQARKKSKTSTSTIIEEDNTNREKPSESYEKELYVPDPREEFEKHSSSDEVQILQPEIFQSNLRKPSFEMQLEATAIPVQADKQIDLLDPRRYSSAKTDQTPAQIDIPENSPIEYQCSLDETIPWKLVPITFSVSPVQFYEVPSSDDSDIHLIDLSLIHQLKNNTNEFYIPGINEKVKSIPQNAPICDNISDDNSSSRELNETNSSQQKSPALLNPGSISSSPTSKSSNNNQTSSLDSNIRRKLQEEFFPLPSIENTRPIDCAIADSPISTPSCSKEKFVQTLGKPVKPKSPNAICNPPSQTVDDPIQDSETATQSPKSTALPSEVVIDGVIDRCSRCLNLVDIKYLTFCMKTGNITLRCHICSLQTVMKNAYKKLV